MNSEYCIEICNNLLRGERSAVETYNLAIKTNGGSPALNDLTNIREDHQEAVATLEQNIRSMGGVPEEKSGAWGVFAQTVQGTADTFGESSAMSSLETGEKTGRQDYENALADEGVMSGCKDMIRLDLLPRITRHIATLEQLRRAA